uniref:Uncharacterized protein n=1 Tax=Megaviridae environmental sample TaxID=1737588 RepID=A0A5J6VJ43_9VIRU|nr:MAG: hypothetical protein [Megaviridae environmental sample]
MQDITWCIVDYSPKSFVGISPYNRLAATLVIQRWYRRNPFNINIMSKSNIIRMYLKWSKRYIIYFPENLVRSLEGLPTIHMIDRYNIEKEIRKIQNTPRRKLSDVRKLMLNDKISCELLSYVGIG